MRRLALCAVLIALVAVAASANQAESTAAPPGTIEFVGKNLMATANGSFGAWRVVESRVDFADLAGSFAVVEVELASVNTGIDRRDNHLRTADFFDVETYPVASARLHSPRRLGVGEDGNERFAVQIDLDLHGVQKTVEAEVWLESKSPLKVRGSVVLDRTEFGVGAAPSRWNPMAVKAEIPVQFRVELPEAR